MNKKPTFGSSKEWITKYIDAHDPSQVFLLTDKNTYQYCRPLLEEGLLAMVNDITVKPGELNKNLNTCNFIWEKLTESGADRHALLINLGGGVIGDMGGLAASLYKRGISFFQVPTTLLSQVDASVGGKLGVDFQGLKNHIGVFNEPDRVIIDYRFLNTLPDRQLKNGFAEMVKHSLIANEEQWNKLCGLSWNEMNWGELIPDSIQIKLDIVNRDFKEEGERKLLNYGHTIGHAIETCLLENKQDIFHGEAIAVGMICEAYLSQKLGYLSEIDNTRVSNQLNDWFPKIEITKDQINRIKEISLQDKKNKNKKILMTALDGIGTAQWDVEITLEQIEESIEFYQSL